MATVEITDLVKAYPTPRGEVLALDAVSLTVADGEFVSIVGPSGCGKTTLLRILAGLLDPTAGTISIDGTPVDGPGRDRALVFQSANLLPWLTVTENVAFGLEAARVPRAEREAVAATLVELVGLAGFEDAYPGELSGGMAQRVGLARALAVDPAVLLMDEPFGELDAQTRERMRAELLDIWARERKTCVFVTHDIEEALFLSDRVVVFGDRPATVRAVVTVPFDRPRSLRGLRADPRFADLADTIGSLIAGDDYDCDDHDVEPAASLEASDGSDEGVVSFRR